MKLSVYVSFEPARLPADLARWNALVPLCTSIDVHRPALLGWGMTGAIAADEMRVFLLEPVAVRTYFGDGVPALLAADEFASMRFLVLCPDESGTPRLPGTLACEAIDAAGCARQAGIDRLLDPDSLRVAEVPYTDAFYRSLATTIFRHVWHRLRPPPKVIAVDCDGTLWRGLCAEDGAAGVQIGAEERALHEVLVAQKRAGRLLALVSKNVPADVEAVFAQRRDLGLTLQDMAARRIGWDAKPQVLAALAEQWRLSLDAFVFIDDSAAECAEMRAALPQVAVIELSGFDRRMILAGAWPLDITQHEGLGEARTHLYLDEARRASERSAAPSFAEYLRSLALRAALRPATAGEFGRVLELTQRTNQFNTIAARPSPAAVREAVARGAVYGVHAADRFGDYGLCGAVFLQPRPGTLHVERLLLSCRVLGRGVEERVIDELLAVARETHCLTLEIAYQQTERNHPARRFLERVTGGREAGADGADPFRFSVASVGACPRPAAFESDVAAAEAEAEAEAAVGGAASTRGAAIDWAAVARHAASAAAPGEPLPDRTDGGGGNRVLSTIAAALGVAVTPEDNLYALGADSLRLVRVVASLRSDLGLVLPIGEVMQHRTVADILELAERQRHAGERVAVEDFSALIQSLYDDEPHA